MNINQPVESIKDLVLRATDATFEKRDVGAVDEFFASNYKEHGQSATDGLEGLRGFVGYLPENFHYELVRALQDGDLVITHGLYHGFEDLPIVAFDIWRVADNKICEHWDSLAQWTHEDLSDRKQIDGARAITLPETTEASKTLVRNFADNVLLKRDVRQLGVYLSLKRLLQHDANRENGLMHLLRGGSSDDSNALVYSKIHQVIAEGEFVFIRAEGTAGAPVVINDLWRVEDGEIVEHWNVLEAIKEDIPHSNGVF